MIHYLKESRNQKTLVRKSNQETANYQIHNLVRPPIHTTMSNDRGNQPSQDCGSQSQPTQGHQGGAQGCGSTEQTGGQADQAGWSLQSAWAWYGYQDYAVNVLGPSPIPMQNARMNTLHEAQRRQQSFKQICQTPQNVDPRATFSMTSTATQTLYPQQGAHDEQPGGAGPSQAPAASGSPTSSRKRPHES